MIYEIKNNYNYINKFKMNKHDLRSTDNEKDIDDNPYDLDEEDQEVDLLEKNPNHPNSINEEVKN